MRWNFAFIVVCLVYPAYGEPPIAPPVMPPDAPEIIPGVDDVQFVAHMSVYDEVASAPPVQSLETPRLRVYTAPNCAPCEAFRQTSLPLLEAKGWQVGRNIEFVDAGSVTAPRFEWITSDGVASAMTGYRGRDAFNAWHNAAVGGGAKSVASCPCGPDCPCVARVAYSGPRQRDPMPPDFVMTELVEPSAVFTEYDEPQGILDGGVQSYQSAPQASYSCANGQCGPVQMQSMQQSYGNCANGQCGPMQAMSVHQQQQGYWTPPQQSHQSHGYRGPVRRVLGGLFRGGCLGGGCR